MKCTQSVGAINSLLNIQNKTYIQEKTITYCFFLHNIDKIIHLEDEEQEIQEQIPLRQKGGAV